MQFGAPAWISRLQLQTNGLFRRDPNIVPSEVDAINFQQILDGLPVALYVTDVEGRITYFNEAASVLWGRRPKLGEEWWCGSYQLQWPDGTPMAHDECPMAITLKSGKSMRGSEAVAVRPDGVKVPFLAYPMPIHDVAGALKGAVNLLVDIRERDSAEHASQRLAALVESSLDAISSATIHDIVDSWNSGATRLYGYAAEDIIGKSFSVIVPIDRKEDERRKLELIRRGEAVDTYETVRMRKDGQLVDVAVTISAIRDREGRITGVSRISRDISELRRVREQQRLVTEEMGHRVKNLTAVIQSLGRNAIPKNQPAIEAFFKTFMDRLRVLLSVGEFVVSSSTRQLELRDVIDSALAPFIDARQAPRIKREGPSILVSENIGGGLALAIHELATNAVKYGALKSESGKIELFWSLDRDADQVQTLHIVWKEHVKEEISEPDFQGFGSRLIRAALSGEKNSKTELAFERDGLKCEFRLQV